MAEWEINKPLGQCCGSDRKLEPGEEYFSALVEIEEGLQRRDFCVEYWQENKPEVYCYWKGRFEAEEKKRKIFVDDDMLMAFFQRLETETDEEKINFRFVLMLILMRKRKLKYDSTETEDGNEIWKLRIVGTKENASVVNPHLQEEQIEQLSGQLGEILQADL